jgi:hypothetical protein
MSDTFNRYLLFSAGAMLLGLAGCSPDAKMTSTPDSGENKIQVASAATALSVDQAQVHLGKIRQHQSVSHDFILTNNSDQTIEILKISKSCGCTSAEVAADEVEPGEQVKLSANLNAQDRVGEFGSRVVVDWKYRGAEPTQQLEMALGAKAVTLIKTSAATVDFGAVDVNQGLVTQKLVIERWEADLEWDGIEVAGVETVGLNLMTVKQNPDRFEVSVTLAPGKQSLGILKRELQIQLTLNGNVLDETVVLPVQAKINGEFVVKPASIFAGVMRQGEKKTGSFTVESVENSTEPFEITAINAPASIYTQLRETGQQNSTVDYELSLEEKGNLSGVIKLEVKRGQLVRNFRVPVIAYVK